jgi:hypothetical protein
MKKNRFIAYLVFFALLGGMMGCEDNADEEDNAYIPLKTEYETFLLGQWKAVESGYYDAQDGKEKLFPSDKYVMEFHNNGIFHTYDSNASLSAFYHLDTDSAFLYRRVVADGENVDALREATDFTDTNSLVHKLTFINADKMRLDYVSGWIVLVYKENPHTISIYKRIK